MKVFGFVSYVYIESNDYSKLDAKARKCFFIGYRDGQLPITFGMIKIEKSLEEGMWYFMRQHFTKPNLVVVQILFDSLDISEVTPQDQHINMGIHVVPQDEIRPSTPPTVLHRSTRSVRAPDRYSPSLDYILLTDSGEPKSYKEAFQDENSSK